MADKVRTEILEGKRIAETIRQQAKQDIASLVDAFPDFYKPKLAIVQVDWKI